jgi:hypothetical protein
MECRLVPSLLVGEVFQEVVADRSSRTVRDSVDLCRSVRHHVGVIGPLMPIEVAQRSVT